MVSSRHCWKSFGLSLGLLVFSVVECFPQFVGDLSRVPSLPNADIKILNLHVRAVRKETRELVLYDQKNRDYTLQLTLTSKLQSARNLGFKHALTLEDLGPGCLVRVSFHSSNLEIRELTLVRIARANNDLSEAPPTTNGRRAKEKDASAVASTLRVDVNLATVGVRVTDRSGKEVSGLNQADFSLFEDDVAQPIAIFSSQEEPVSLAVMLDRSFSMGEDGRFEQAKAAAVSLIGLVKSMNRESEFLYLGFHSEVEPIVGFEGNERHVQRVIQNTTLVRSGTSLYDAIIQGLELTRKARHKRQALVVFTDGADQHSHFRLEDLIESVQSSQAQVFVVGCFKPEEDALFRHSGERLTLISGKPVDNPRSVFRRLAEESGAEYFFPQKAADVSHVAGLISQHLRHQYALGYYPQRSETSGYRRIRVTVNSKAGLRITARHGLRLDTEDRANAAHSSRTTGPAVPGLQEVLGQSRPFEPKVREKEGGLKEYREDFSDPSSGWPHDKGAFYEKNSYHVVEAEKVVANGPWFRDFQAFVTVELKKGLWQLNSPDEMSIIRAPNIDGSDGMIGPRIATMGGGPGAGLVFRLNENGYYALLLSGLPKGKKSFAKLVRKDIRRDKLIDLIPWMEVRDSVNPQGQERIGVLCSRDSIKLFLGKTLIGSYLDDALGDGMVGLVLTGEGHAVFSDLVVEGKVLLSTGNKTPP